MDLGVGDADLAEGVAVGGPQVEEPAVRRSARAGVRADEGGGGAERPGDSLVDVGADLVAGRGDGGANPGDDVGRARAKPLHGGDGRGGYPRYRAAPARVHAGEHAGHRIVQHDRHAVRGQDREHHAGKTW